jgi:endonuclease YncB( thermonuclease family)
VSEVNAGRCIALVDADTLQGYLEASLPFLGTTLRASQSPRVRLLGVNAPERRTPGGPAATAFTLNWVRLHAHLDALGSQDTPLRFAGDRRDAFGRLLAVVTCGYCGANLCLDLLSAGHAAPYRALAHADALLDLERAGHSHARRLLDALAAP